MAITIAARPATVTADPKSKMQGPPDPPLTYQSANLVNGDSFTGALTRASGESVGAYPIQQRTLALNNNYTLTYVGANLTINYGFTGLLSPYPPDKADKIKSAIPIKWQYADFRGVVVPSSLANPSITIYGPYSQESTAIDGDAITLDDAGKSGYQYDSLTNMWQFNWKTTGLNQGIYYIKITGHQTGQVNENFSIYLVK